MRIKASNDTSVGSVWNASTVSFSPLPGDAGFTPIDFFGLKLWLDASDIAGTSQLLPLSNGSSIDKLLINQDSLDMHCRIP